MRAIVVGAGEVGFDIARILSAETHDVVIIDVNPDTLEEVQGKLDVMTVQGSGTAADTLVEAGVSGASLLVAVTAVDEVNIIACMLADRLGVETTIARVRSDEFTNMKSVLRPKDFGVDHIIHPEESAAREIVRLVKRASATDVQPFAGGRAQLVGLRITEDSPVVNLSLNEVAEVVPTRHFRVMAISRGIRTLLPVGTDTLRKGDHVFILGFSGEIPQILPAFVRHSVRLDDIMILGGGSIGSRVASQLSRERKKGVKVIERDRAQAELLANRLADVLVIHGDPTDVDLLAVEGIGEMDAVLAVTADEESNLVTCLLAKHLGVQKTVALLSKSAYIPIGERIGLDAAVSVKQSVSREVLRVLRGKHVLSIATVHGLDAEILEVSVNQKSKLAGKCLEEIALPPGILFGLVASDSRIEIATGRTQIRDGDTVIAFVLPKQIEHLKKLLGGE